MKRLSTFLIIFGIIIAISPYVVQQYNAYQENKEIQQWLDSEDSFTSLDEEITEADLEDSYEQLQDVFSEGTSAKPEQDVDNKVYSSVYSSSGDETTKKTTKKVVRKPRKQNILGIIKIKKIKVNLPIIEGTGREQLRSGIGHIIGTTKLGQSGNCVLAGHRNYAFATYFNRLGELISGDEVVLITKKTEYSYRVFARFVVTPSDVSVLKNNNKKKNILTLITCTPPYKASHRLIVQAELIGTKNRATK